MRGFLLSSLSKRNYAWLLAGCGVGKTLTALSTMQELGTKINLVITTKAAMNDAWLGDITRFTEGVDYLILNDGNTAQKGALLVDAVRAKRDKPLIAVVNYTTAQMIAPMIRLIAPNINMVVTDESHKVKTHNSQTSLKLAEACYHIRYKIAMTGTPFEDRPTDTYGQVRWLDPVIVRRGHHSSKVFGTWNEFFDMYVRYRTVGGHIKIPFGYQNIDHMMGLVEPFIHRVKSDDVLDLPDELHIQRKVDLPPAVRKMYDAYAKKYIAEYEGTTITADLAITLAMRLHQITCGYHPDLGRIDDTKVECLLDILDEIGGKPTVIFTTFGEDVSYLKETLTKQGFNVKLLVGGTHEHVDFQSGDGDILIANMAAGSEGVNLTRARYCIYYSKSHSRSNYVQSKARIRRPGADLNFPVTYYHIMMNDTVDDDIQDALDDKGDITQRMYERIGSYGSR